MSSNPETLKVEVAEDIKSNDVPPGTPAPTEKDITENLPEDEVEKRRKIMLEYTRLSSRYCEPHNKRSRFVTKEDIGRVVADGKDLVTMCNLPRGNYSGISALAHSQIDDVDPLRFFVLPTGMVIINPVIFKNTTTHIFKEEACLSFPYNAGLPCVPRFNKVSVMYQTLAKQNNEDESILTDVIVEDLKGGLSHVFQHEISHLNGSNIYDEGFQAESALGLGDGPMSEEEVAALYK